MKTDQNAIPLGYCATCRWAHPLEEANTVDAAWPVECRGLPITWLPQQGKGKMVDPMTGKPGTVVMMTRLPAWKRLDDYCSLWAPRPAGTDLGGGLGGFGGPVGVPRGGS